MNLSVINSVRTNNFTDELVIKKITGMWKEASSKLENHTDTIYGVYSDYESNYKGDYTLSVAIESSSGKHLIEIPPNSKYETFSVDTSNEHGVMNTWKEIWQLEEKGTLKRAYTYDLEKYYPNGEIEIHIAVM
ncbi:AraC family transcriptional regulator [Ornithinibacillus sp. L9]|uniref:AraC family transcriptional regulator n=1 Tax=Ornithinibacillus caprae TaxID=2678566 RepID=A0A6N8FFZ4_9BACI|nr:effector binding domain-containing protein [Ornithinibacillus caprae]MUK88365.1 AraC family transcriptional regulator [Ornithinibacillus caprae]